MNASVFSSLSQWSGDATWLAMDASARGFHTQLMLLSLQQNPVGSLPDKDDLWRRWLGLPEAGEEMATTPSSEDEAARMLLKESLEFGKSAGVPEALVLALHPKAQHWRSTQGQWLDFLWRERWKPMLLEAWPVIDAEWIKRYPELAGHQGRRFSPLAKTLADGSGMNERQTVGEPETDSPTKKTRKTPQKRARRARTAQNKKAPGTPRDEMLEALLEMTPATEALSNRDFLNRCWQTPPFPEQRVALWDMGLRLLKPHSNETQARSFLGKLIRDYGEASVAKALAETSVKTVPPAEVKSFLIGVLKRETQGSPAEQQTLAARARVAL